MDFFTLAKNRYSVRKFSERSVEPEKLEKVLEAARVAPTAHNYQPFRIYVLKSKDAIAKIRELTPCAFNAPIVLMVTICRDEQWVNELEKGFLSGQVDAGIIGTHLMLEAWEQGLGSCWVQVRERFTASGMPSGEYVHEVLDIPLQLQVLSVIAIGHKGMERKPFNEDNLQWEKIHINKYGGK